MEKSALFLREVTKNKESENTLFKMLDVDFPRMSRIPLFMLRRALASERLAAVHLSDGHDDYGYAIYQHVGELDAIHVLYLAIMPEYRSHGLGSVMLERLRELSNGRVFLDVEDPACAKANDKRSICERRIEFYRRGGFELVPGFRFYNGGFYLLLMATFSPPAETGWLELYRKIYDNAYTFPLSCALVKEY